MRNFRFAALLFASSFLSLNSYASLTITGVFDGPLSGGLPKGVELYVTRDIPDLSIYGLGSANNGGGSDGEEFSFPSDSAIEGEFIYIAFEEAGFAEYLGFIPDYTSSMASINGDDAIELFENGTVIDLFGDINVDGSGEPWEYLDGWAYRNNGSTPSPVFNLSDWQFSGPNALDGTATNETASTPIPIAAYEPEGGDTGEPGTTVIINEVDADTDGTDVLEFIELFDGGVGNTDLSGLSIVLYNGSDDASYNAFDLDGFSTNAAGYFVLGNPGVANLDLDIGASNIIQNGADAVALVAGDASDFPNDTPISTSDLIDAIVYDTNDGEDSGLLVLLNAGQPQVNEGGNAGSSVDSNQRCDNGTGGGRNTEAYLQAAPTPGADNACEVAIELQLISTIQGNPDTHGSNGFGETDVSPLVGQQVMIEGIVVGDFQNNDTDSGRSLGGFYLQEESTDEDGDPASSEGIFVFDSSFGVDVQLGDQVRVTGTVDQFFGETQLDNIISVEILNSDRLADVTVATIHLPAATVTMNQNDQYQPDLEAFEGMLVTIAGSLQITEQFQLDRFNEIKLVAGGRPFQFTQLNAPNTTLFEAAQQELGARRITYDDGLNDQNADIGLLDGFAGYNEATAKRMGDTVTNLTGVMDYKWAGSGSSGATWRVRSHEDGTNSFTSKNDGNSPNPRPVSPPSVIGNLKIASTNILNFFTTLDDGSTLTAVGIEPRGADDLTSDEITPATAELDRQLQKLVEGLTQLDADILGLVEIENEFDPVNDGSTAIEYLVNAINTKLGSNVYDYVYPGSRFVGTDAIAVALLYKPGTVSIAEGSAAVQLNDTVAATLPSFSSRNFTDDPIFNGESTNRVSLAVTFTHNQSSESITVAVNHFKSKGSSGLSDTLSPNYDQGDGAAFWNQRRLDAAIALNEWLATNPTGNTTDHVVVLGDLNAYALEAPVQHLLVNGFNNVKSIDDYSFVFDGQIGTLDYLLVSDSLLSQFTEAAVWHINADEADALDYNLNFGKDAGYFEGGTATRHSDHDPLVAGFNFATAPSVLPLLDYYLNGISNETIMGKGRSQRMRLINARRFEEQLRKANYALVNDKAHILCKSLNRARLTSDGDAARPDLIEGQDLLMLNQKIIQLMNDLSCR